MCFACPSHINLGRILMQEGKTPASVAETNHHIKAGCLPFGWKHGRQADLKGSPLIILWAWKNVFKGPTLHNNYLL